VQFTIVAMEGEWQGSLAAMIANTERNLQGFQNKDNQMSQFNALHAVTRMEATYDKVFSIHLYHN